MNNKRFSFYALMLSTTIAFVGAAFAKDANNDEGFIVIQASDLDWSGNEIKTHILHGNPSEAGLYIMRIRFPANTMSRPHIHDQDRFITVIEGTWYAGTDASYDPEKTVAIAAGGFMKHPAGAVHYDGAKDKPVIVEIRGMGPVKTTGVKIEGQQ